MYVKLVIQSFLNDALSIVYTLYFNWYYTVITNLQINKILSYQKKIIYNQ